MEEKKGGVKLAELEEFIQKCLQNKVPAKILGKRKAVENPETVLEG